jgi:hypothetical protein
MRANHRGYRRDSNGLALALTLATLVLAAATIALLWPGIAAFDTVRQYEEALQGSYDDWHPPIMAWLWSRLIALHLAGTGPMLVLQLGLYWLGLGLVALGLVRSGARRAGWVVLLAGLSPVALDWMLVVVKDAQLVGAMTAAFGIVAGYRLARRPLPWWAIGLVALLLVYAVLARANAAFAVVPLAVALAGWGGVRHWIVRAGLLLVVTLLAIGASDLVNHRLLGAERSHVERTLPVFDMVGIGHDARLDTIPGLSEEEWAGVERQHCYTPFYWDPFGDPSRCGPIGDDLMVPDGPSHIERDWVGMIVAHPLAYAQHRLAHLNSTLRVVTPADEASATGPAGSQPNDEGIGTPATPASRAVQQTAAAVARTPFGSPGVWLVWMALIGWVLLATPRQPARELGLALALSACLMTASFAVVSIASDLRYHLWLMVATPLALVLLGVCRKLPFGRLATALLLAVLVAIGSVIARAHGVTLPH